MLLVLAYEHDVAARALVARWRSMGEDAGVLSIADLSEPGWVHAPGDGAAGRLVVEHRRIQTRDLRGVVTRVSCVTEGETSAIHPEDRLYAAAEMQAFLLAWLTSLPCPVLNRPSAQSLTGPARSMEQWAHRARRLKIPCHPIVRRSSFDERSELAPDAGAPRDEVVTVDVVGTRAFGLEAAGPLGRMAVALARDAGADLLRVTFTRPADGADSAAFAGANVWLDVAADAVAEAITERILGAGEVSPGAVAVSS